MAAASLDMEMAGLAEALGAAAIGQQPWEVPLDRLAALTGAHAGELICISSPIVQILTGLPPGTAQQLAQSGGHDPRVNSRIRVGLATAPMAIIDEADVDTAGDSQRYPDYGDFLRRMDIEHICLTTLVRQAGDNIGLSVMRGRKAGNIEADEKRVFAAAAWHFRAAIRMHLALEQRAIQLTAAAFDQLGNAAFVLDRRGQLRAWTASAEALVEAGDLRVASGRLALRNPADRALETAIERARLAYSVADPAPATAIAHDVHGLAYPLEVTPLPSLHGLPFDAGALIVARPPRAIEKRAARMAALLFGLTRAEAAVTGLLAAGVAPLIIADRQGVSIGTVRTHIHRILDKAGARGQTELVSAVLSRL